ncbi:transcriptional regulator [Thiothrix litoralis]|jgi:predicted transcriptional regulator|uniref:Transcriptional regulator n=1 Tax=Thiothrix litoralis TaxID=2891210 RepID=A0ABX7WQG9_9GAMM|nr:transcriptional regulator [Thiothrix litoralis]QTR46104.1 transcriptional regulator [Thiothrix litoralis]
MKTLTIRILDEAAAIQDMQQRFINTWESGEYAGEFLTFESPAALFRAITPKRWELISKLQGLGKVSLRELARQTQRDVHRIYDDVNSLKALGIVEQDDKGISIPYQKIHTDFTLSSVAA